MQIKSRPVPLLLRQDLHIEKVLFGGETYALIKDPVAIRYHQLRADQWFLLSLLDGERSLEDLRDAVVRRFPTVSVTEQDIQQLLLDFHDKNLIVGLRSGQGKAMIAKDAERRTKSFLKVVQNPLFIQFPGFNSYWLLARLNVWIGWLFSRWAIVPAMLFALLALTVVGWRYGEIRRQLPGFQQFFAWPNLIYLWITLGATKLIHEFGHALACRRFNRECNGIGVALMVMSPTMYCDASDSWMLPNKWHRIAIAAAGMYIEILLASAAIFLWTSSSPGLFRNLCLNVFFISTVTTVIFNANPLIRFDGYYILADWLEIPNLREKASKLLQRWFAWSMGKQLPPDSALPRRRQGWFVVFAVASAIYRWFVVNGIFMTLHASFKPYRLQSIGVTWAVLSMGDADRNDGRFGMENH